MTPRQLRRRLLKLVRPVLPTLGLSILFRTAGLTAGIALVAIAGWAVADITDCFWIPSDFGDFESCPFSFYTPALATLAVLALVKGLARYLEQYCGHYVAFRVLARLRLYFYEKLAPQAPAAVLGRETGDLLSRVTKDVDRVEVFFAHTIAPAVTAVIVPVAAVVFTAVAISPSAALTLAVGLALVGLATPARGRRASAEGATQIRRSRGELAGQVRDSVQGVREVIAFGYENRRLAQLEATGRGLGAGLKATGRTVAERRGLNVLI
ncbi:MAG: hypothetical protein LBG11_03755, partial [Bifidobacteriaceae bacterium]|nr:hypothetical protein [Bifidobacteriaceae bacterium]